MEAQILLRAPGEHTCNDASFSAECSKLLTASAGSKPQMTDEELARQLQVMAALTKRYLASNA